MSSPTHPLFIYYIHPSSILTKQKPSGIIFNTKSLYLNPHQITTRLPLTITIQFVSTLPSARSYCSGSLEPESSCHDRDWRMELPMEADILTFTGILTPGDASVASSCSGSLEPESSCHDRDWIMELPMEADILTFTGILTPEDASVASCFPFDITISLSWFPVLSMPPLHSAIP